MNSLCFAIATAIMLTSVMLPGLPATAAEDATGEHSAAWDTGYADAVESRDFKNPYSLEDSLNNTDYICGFIAGKSMRNG